MSWEDFHIFTELFCTHNMKILNLFKYVKLILIFFSNYMENDDEYWSVNNHKSFIEVNASEKDIEDDLKKLLTRIVRL